MGTAYRETVHHCVPQVDKIHNLCDVILSLDDSTKIESVKEAFSDPNLLSTYEVCTIP